MFIFYLSPSTIILLKYSTFIEVRERKMITWKRVTAKEASETIKARQRAAVAAAPDPELCEGDVQLEIKPFESFQQITKYTKYLSTLENVKIVSESWSEEDGFTINVSVKVPLALGHLLQDMPDVACVHITAKKTGRTNGCKKLVVETKTSAPAAEPVPA